MKHTRCFVHVTWTFSMVEATRSPPSYSQLLSRDPQVMRPAKSHLTWTKCLVCFNLVSEIYIHSYKAKSVFQANKMAADQPCLVQFEIWPIWGEHTPKRSKIINVFQVKLQFSLVFYYKGKISFQSNMPNLKCNNMRWKCTKR